MIVPLVTRPASTDAISAPCPCAIAFAPLVVREVVTRVSDAFVVFDAAVEIPTVPAVRATVVITIAATFFFVDICMSPVPCFLSKPSYRLVSNKPLYAQKGIPFFCETLASFRPTLVPCHAQQPTFPERNLGDCLIHRR